MNELALFAGAGGGILGGVLSGFRTVCAVEWEPYAQAVLLARQADGILERFPIWDDIRTFDGIEWRNRVDVITGGFPCQDISSAGKGKGINGERSGLWKEMHRVVREVRPRFVLIENSPMLTIRGLGRVLGDLASIGFNARWNVFSASDIGANHERERIWIMAYPAGTRIDNDKLRSTNVQKPNWWKSRPNRVDDGVAHRVDRLKAIGNGQVPSVAATAFRILSEGLI